MKVFLKPLLHTDKHFEPYAVADIEASNWINHLVTGFYTKDSEGKDILEYFYKVDEFLRFVLSNKNPVNEVHAHFGGKYDFLFFLNDIFGSDEFYAENMIPRASGLLCFDLFKVEKTKDKEEAFLLGDEAIIGKVGKEWHYKGRKVTFYDTSALLPFSLESLTKNFGVEHKKLKIDYNFNGVTPELLTYLEYDLKGLYQVLEKYREWPLIKKAGPAITMASQAMRVFRTTLKRPLRSLSPKVDEFVRGAYFGGRTEIFKPLFEGDEKNLLHCFDVNSLYPTVMRSIEHFPGNFKARADKYNPEELGFYDAEVEVPEDMYVPPLGIVHDFKHSSKFIFPTGRFKGRWSTMELEYAKSVGVKVLKTGKGLLFEDAGPLFREYVDMLYDIRKRSEKNSVDNVLTKLLMNSCYGRFGLNPERQKIEVDTGQLGVKLFVEMKGKRGLYRLMTRDVNLDSSFTNVAIAAWVTSGARIHMHKIYSGENLYYTDTDSLFTTKTFPEDNELGGLKLEYSCDSACFLLPKTYIVKSPVAEFLQKTEEGDMVRTDRKIVMKGFDKRDITHFQLSDFVSALEGDLHRLKASTSPKIATFRTALRKGNLLTMLDGSERQIRSAYDKRRIIKTASGYDTMPLVIKDGEVINLE